jgi:hypothetical protein
VPRRLCITLVAVACALVAQAPPAVSGATVAADDAHVARKAPRSAKGCHARRARKQARRVRHRSRRACARRRAATRRAAAPGPAATRTGSTAPIAPAPGSIAPAPPAPQDPIPAEPAPAPPSDPPPSDPPPSDPPPGEPAASEAPADPLRWAPPALTDPITIELGTGYTHTTLSTARDYVVRLPPTQKVGATWIEGGHNVVIVGGSVTIPADLPADAPSAQRTAIYVKGATGTVHIEGVLIDGAGASELDGVDVAAPQATVQLQNLRIVGIHGGLGSFHADVVQPWGGVHELRIDRLTGTSNYQGLMLADTSGAIGSAQLSRIDLTATTEPAVDYGGHMILLRTSGDSSACATYPVDMQDVHVIPRPGRTLVNSVYPAGVAGACPGMTGAVTAGPPAGGSWVPAGVAGVGYVSPGYQ